MLDVSSLLSSTSTTSATTTFTPVILDASLLSAHYSARLANVAANTTKAASSALNHGPAVIAPWENQTEDSLVARIAQVRGIDKFIDLNSATVKSAGDDKDSKALFALYSALTKLKTIAEYGADDKTTTGLLSTLNKKFQQGLAEVQQYLQSTDLDKLTLMFGEKKSNIVSGAALGKNTGVTVGNTVQTGAQDGVVPGLDGTEVFTVGIKVSGVTENFTVDLAQLNKPLTLGNIAAAINEKIDAVKKLDGNGNPVLDTNGNPISKYTTRFNVQKISETGYAFKIVGSTTEDVHLSAAVSAPSLYLTGASKPLAGDGITTGALTELTDLDSSDPTRMFRQTIAGQADAPLVLPPDKTSTTTTTTVAAKPNLADTASNGTVTDSQGNVYVVGQTRGDLGNQLNGAATQDVYLTKYDSTGKAVWNRLLGASDKASGFAITVDSTDNVIIAGQVNSTVSGVEIFKGDDSFVAKYDSSGTKVWTRQLDTLASDSALAVTVDASDNVVVAGEISGKLNSAATYGGGKDSYVAILDKSLGTVTASGQYGGAGDESTRSVGVTADGNIVVGGVEDGHAVVRKLDAANLSNILYSVDLGALNSGSVQSLKVDGNAIYVAGYTGNPALAGAVVQAHQGDSDGFVTRIDDNGSSGSAAWTSYIGTGASDQIADLVVNNGSIYVAGKTSGTFAGQYKTGTTDAFAAKIDGATGATAWVEQIGGVLGYNGATGLAFSSQGNSVLSKLGLPNGTVQTIQSRNIQTQTSALPGEYFYISVNGGTKQKITISEGDDFKAIATKINRVSFQYIKAEQTLGTDAGQLKITPLNDASIQIFAGDGDKDALKHLGMEPTTVLPASTLFDIGSSSAEGADPNKLGGVFALSLQSNFNVQDKKAAAYVSAQLDTAISNVQRAFRSLTYDPVKAEILKQSKASKGTVPAYLSKQIASYQDALFRIQAITGSSTTV